MSLPKEAEGAEVLKVELKASSLLPYHGQEFAQKTHIQDKQKHIYRQSLLVV